MGNKLPPADVKSAVRGTAFRALSLLAGDGLKAVNDGRISRRGESVCVLRTESRPWQSRLFQP